MGKEHEDNQEMSVLFDTWSDDNDTFFTPRQAGLIQSHPNFPMDGKINVLPAVDASGPVTSQEDHDFRSESEGPAYGKQGTL